MKKIILLTMLAFTIAGCAHNTPEPVLVITAAPPVVAPALDPLVTAPVVWKAYNAAQLKVITDNLIATGGSIVLFTLDEANFKNLAENLKGIDKLVKQQNASIDFLTKAANAPADQAKAAATTTVKK
jgi:hypothetical protein